MSVRIRSIVQHAWAETEHDLGCKNPDAIPVPVRRRFSRLAGLLEVADSEFCEIRDEIARYQQVVAHEVTDKPDAVAIDSESVEVFIKSALVRKVDRALARATNGSVTTTARRGDFAVTQLRAVGLNTIGEVQPALAERADLVPKFAHAWAPDHQGGWLPGISLFYLCYLLAAETGSIDAVSDYLVAARIMARRIAAEGADAARRRLAQRLLAVYEEVATEEG